MQRRTVKKIIFGIFYSLILSAVILGIYFIFLKPNPTCFDNKQNQNEEGIDCGGICMPCGIKYAQDLQVLEIKNFPAGDNRTILLAQIKNLNTDFSAGDFVFKFSLIDMQGNKIKEILGHSFIYIDEIKYLIGIADIGIKDFSKANLDFADFKWIPKENFKKPNVVAKEFKTEIYNPQENALPIYIFTRDLFTGLQGEDVSKLQEFLKAEKVYDFDFTAIFDLKTKTALTNYQKANNLIPAKGYFDANTRNFVNAKIDEYKKMISETAEIYPISISGIVKNNDIISASKIVLTGIIYDNFGLIIGASKTELENLNPTDERAFKIIFSRSIELQSINPSASKIYIDAIR